MLHTVGGFGFIPRRRQRVYNVTLRNAETLAIIGEGRATDWREVAIREYNAFIDSKVVGSRLYVHVKEEKSPTRMVVQLGRRIPGTGAIDLDPPIVVDVVDDTVNAPVPIFRRRR